jgi:hypothetical protein
MSLDVFRDALPPAYRDLPEAEVAEIRDRLYDLADLVLEVALVTTKETHR